MTGRIEPTRLTLARRILGKSKSELATALAVAPATIVSWEDGTRSPSVSIHVLSSFLRQPEAFFTGAETSVTVPEKISFRKRYDATREEKDKAAATIDMAAGVLSPSIEKFFGTLPPVDVPNLSGMRPEAAAEALRLHWNLEDGPIRNVVEQLEARGIQVFWTSNDSPSLSAFCKRVSSRPYIILNTAKRDGCRSRFDACHELAHLVLHQDIDFEIYDQKQIEKEADAFASAFLMPRDPIIEDCPNNFDLEALFEVKRVWKVSIQSITRRLYDLGVLTQWQYEQAFRIMSAKGWRKSPEPLAGPMESSRIHWIFCDRLENIDKSPQMFADEIGVSWDIVANMMPVLALRGHSFSFHLASDEENILEKMVHPSLPFDD